ncbi:MAG: MBOAT family protein [Lachnospiraceae bacterium]|nr:MBOAT family protein [Lachnospiraceae bacterium]
MVFSTILFLCVFLPIVIIGYYIVPAKAKNIFLLLASLFFYAWGEPGFIWIMLFSVVCNYGFGMLIWQLSKKQEANAEKGPYLQAWKKKAAVLAVILNLGILFLFKYFTFCMETIREAVNGEFSVVQIALPIGISFYTFQGLSYVIDVYRMEGKKDEKGEVCHIVQKNPLHLALYISMFPQLIAGPIVRYTDIAASLTERKTTSAMFAAGAERFIIGLAKKAILANMVGRMAADIFLADSSNMGMKVAWLGAIAYTLQIYFDFSGYSDMAIGLGNIFGFTFMENFRHPYISTSIREFWRRWHISLSSWFRDYLYIPMGGSRKGNVYVHLLIVFVATGIWHGAGFGFLVWGLWHGIFIILERYLGSRMAGKATGMQKDSLDKKNMEEAIGPSKGFFKRVHKGSIWLIKWLYTMLVVITGWVMFNLVSLKDGLSYLAIMFGIHKADFIAYDLRYYLSNQNICYFVIAVLGCLPFGAIVRHIPVLVQHKDSLFWLAGKRICLLALLMLSFVFIINSSYNPFIYFRF